MNNFNDAILMNVNNKNSMMISTNLINIYLFGKYSLMESPEQFSINYYELFHEGLILKWRQ